MRFPVLLTALCVLATGPAFASPVNPFTYRVDIVIDSTDSLTGTISTDGTIGAIANSDITGYDLTISSGASSYEFVDGGILNNLSETGLTATASDLLFDPASDNGFASIELDGLSGLTFCLNYSACGNRGTVDILNVFTYSIASAPIPLNADGLYEFATITPEPSSLILLGTGVLGVAGAARRRLRAR